MDDIEGIFDRAAELYAARRVLDDSRHEPGAIGIAELYRVLTDPDSSLTDGVSRALFASPVLRRQFLALRDRLAVVQIPMLAAASDGTLTERSFPGGTLSLIPARSEGQMYLILRLTDPAETSVPLRLVATGPDGAFAARALPIGDSGGEIMIILDNTKEDSALLRLLEDPLSEAALLPASLSSSQTEIPE